MTTLFLLSRRGVCIALLLGVSLPGLAGAQVIQRPPRVYRGLFGGSTADPNRWRQELILAGNLLGGHDQNLDPTAGSAPSVTPTVGIGSVYTGFSGAQLRYRRVKGVRWMEASARGFMNTFRKAGLEPAFGGGGRAQLSLPSGRRTALFASEEYSDEPLYFPSTASPPVAIDTAAAAQPVSTVNATTGFVLRRTQRLSGNLSVQRRWTPRDTLTVGLNHNASRYEDQLGDTRQAGGQVSYARTAGRNAGLSLGYVYSNASTTEADGARRPLRDHSATLGGFVNRRISRERQLSFSLGGGATYVSTIGSTTRAPFTYVTPTGYASLRVDLTRTWSAWTDYGRTVSVVEGVTADEFVTNTVTVRAGGLIGRKADLAFSGGWATGETWSGAAGTYDSVTAITQLQLSLARWCALLISHTFYAYRLFNVATLTPQALPNLDRNAVRVGFTFSFPLVGTFSESTRAQDGRN